MATITIGGRSYEVEVRNNETVTVDGQEFAVSVERGEAYDTVTVGGIAYRVALPPEGERESGMAIEVDHRPFTLQYEGWLGGGPARPRAKPASASAAAPPPASVAGGVPAQLSGKVLRIEVGPGDTVEAGQLLLVLEAMKMENEINAPAAGSVKEVPVAEGDQVAEGDILIVLDPAE